MNRLKKMGMKTINHDEYKTLKNVSVLIRAHGEPPETYAMAKKNNIDLIEATCPIVLKLQNKVNLVYANAKTSGGQLVIIGNKTHPEVIGLWGQTNRQAIIIQSIKDIDKINFKKPIHLFAQTTISADYYEDIKLKIEYGIKESGGDLESFKVVNSICKQVSGRIPKLKEFCRNHDVVIFVSGKKSSNGKSLFQVCKQEKPASYFISSPEEIDMAWFSNAEKIGISGATSTPTWLMKNVADKILNN
ncbi:MAG: 4-hydroxy-3-methylbut-2-enyl diphosphate reductase [Bacteroidales bacterium]